MGCNDSEQTSNSSFSQQTAIDPMGVQEHRIVNQLQRLGVSQADAIKFAMDQFKQGTGLIGLQGADKALLEQAFGGAERSLRRQAYLLGQDMAGTRGLNRSDTPVAESVLREMLPQFANLDSQKAGQSLGLGLNLANLRQQNLQNLLYGSQIAPNALTRLANRFQQERFATGRTTGTSTSTMRGSPGLMDQIGTGIGLVGQIGALGAGFMAPGASGAASGAGTSSAGYGGGLGLSRGSVGSMFG